MVFERSLDHCAFSVPTESQRTDVVGEKRTIPPTQLTHKVVSGFTDFAEARMLQATYQTHP